LCIVIFGYATDDHFPYGFDGALIIYLFVLDRGLLDKLFVSFGYVDASTVYVLICI
jgi:hypothetical protein